ncbi:MAG: biotin/lipoate A/B protein ligase family protein [Candidatus Kapaibacterium sp.]
MSIFQNNFTTEISFDMPGAYHMARDLKLAEELRDDPNASNVLRLYSWKPYCISLGYQQDQSQIDVAACKSAGVDIIRRPTGGRAVYHAEELTYAVIMRFEPGEGIYAVHNKIAESLLEALQPLCKNELELTSSRNTDSIRESYKEGALTNIACFTSTARYEITWKGKKVVGSAQRRFGNAVLQHGSILLSNEHLQLPDFLKLSDEEKLKMLKMLKEETATISDIAQVTVRPENTAEYFLETAAQ